jgi:amino acid transporter
MENYGATLHAADADTGTTARRDEFVPVLGIASLLAVAVGTVVGQGPIVSVLQGIGLGGTGFLVVLLISFGIAICNAITFAELSLMFPRTGGLSTYT